MNQVFYVTLILSSLLFSFAVHASSQTMEDDLACLSHIHSTMAPYHSIPGLRGHMEHHSLQKHPDENIFFWDSVNKKGEKVRTLVSEHGSFACTIKEDVDIDSIKLDTKAIKSGGPNVLREGGIMPRLIGSAFNCRKLSDTDAGLNIQQITSKYLGLLPEFYEEKLIDLSVRVQDAEERYRQSADLDYIIALEKSCTRSNIQRQINGSHIRRHTTRVMNIFRHNFGLDPMPSSPGNTGSSSGRSIQ